ncbi:tRNA (adenosine(37)-N6)-threonylcarbamoyltransferase complex dimerization subunit type 1 TsaB [Tunicatimonas pelagia]|uniref:tRNA (adenosine(37)-N6)-threonylcarbamoyltransferase complex dimerization subunit type 1 TsaB n=1 Tax=Tunicatimonas pelagia TaxID=931531 RepID=UPI002666F9F0|nr:tRNA (adenosine(37)-N6)-threonylcarbamoyltransferase complex dimerization subunit type 1 TsaB [Tunicatimonas pelagia]WKN42226.1 tRNA (adenosine(37)-N6)-threonylcarbamoyltransferase complex dimerization subunit type 1 TsaB [Tunicatimonas pelagia]
MIILSIETATKTCSVALHQNRTLLGLQEVHLDKSHSSLLHVMIDNLLQHCEVERSQLNAVAVSIGPGSYTGLRIGVSAVKGIGYALDIPVIAVNTLEAMTRGMQDSNLAKNWLCPMLDARRMEVYCLLQDDTGKLMKKTQPLVIDEESFRPELDQHSITFFGNGSDKCQPLLQHPNAHFVPNALPSARWVGELALRKYEEEDFEDLAYFVPFYLKEYRTTQPKKKLLR